MQRTEDEFFSQVGGQYAHRFFRLIDYAFCVIVSVPGQQGISDSGVELPSWDRNVTLDGRGRCFGEFVVPLEVVRADMFEIVGRFV